MGTVIFLILWAAGWRAEPNDYQWLPLLVSIDSVAGVLLLFRCGRPQS